MISAILLAALRKAMGFRCDGKPQLTYFPPEYYGVESEPFSFYSGKWKLRGARYLPKVEKPKGVLVFFHGIGAGACSYTQEICAFAKQGYLVYAYDNTGCMTSEGEGIYCLAQPLLDQEAFFEFLDHDEPAQGLTRYAAGHSWGGYTAFGALDPKFHVKKVVSISGFISLPKLLISQEKILGKFETLLRRALKKGYGPKAGIDMTEMVRNAEADLLYVQGEADPLITKAENYDVLAKLFPNNPKVKLLLVEGAMHHPYWKLESNRYLRKLEREENVFGPNFINDYAIDYERLNADEPAVMQQIFAFLEE